MLPNKGTCLEKKRLAMSIFQRHQIFWPEKIAWKSTRIVATKLPALISEVHVKARVFAPDSDAKHQISLIYMGAKACHLTADHSVRWKTSRFRLRRAFLTPYVSGF